jgi:photosystem II stability/assembly factor-like uncharacterized protein
MRNTLFAICVAALIVSGPLHAQPWQFITKFHGASINTLLVSGTDVYTSADSLYRSKDSGVTWTAILAAPRFITHLASMGTVLLASTYVSPSSAALWRSEDFGVTWIKATDFANVPVDGITIKDTEIFLIRYERLMRSRDMGQTWTFCDTANTLTNAHSLLTIQATGQVLYAGTGIGVFRSTDDGDTWTEFDSGIENPVNAQAFIQKDSLIFANINGKIYRASKLGAGWLAVDNGLPSPIYSKELAVIGNSVFVAGNSGSTFRSTDDGLTWIDASTGLPATVKIDHFASLGSLLFAGVGPNGIYRASIEGVESEVPKNRDEVHSGFSLYPNPAREAIIITFGLQKSSLINIQLFDVMGTEVSSAHFEALFERGNQAVPLSLRDLPAGKYYARIVTSSGEARTVKLVKE